MNDFHTTFSPRSGGACVATVVLTTRAVEGTRLVVREEVVFTSLEKSEKEAKDVAKNWCEKHRRTRFPRKDSHASS